MAFKLDEKFLLLEFDSSKRVVKRPVYELNKFYNNVFRMSGTVIGDYYEDSNCGYLSIELSTGYLIYLIHLPKSKDTFLKNREIMLKTFNQEEGSYWLHRSDELNIFKHLITDLNYTSNNNDIRKALHVSSYLNFPLLFKNNQIIIYRKIFLEKKMYSHSEMVYWSNVCLKLMNAFQNNLIFRHNKLMGLEQFTSPLKYEFEILEEIKKISKGNPIYFLIDGCLAYNLKKVDLSKELNILLFDKLDNLE